MKKYGRIPTSKEYREIVQKNLLEIIIPIASINLFSLIEILRPTDHDEVHNSLQLKEYDGQHVLIEGGAYNNALDINTHYFSLEENDAICVTNKYLQARIQRTQEYVEEYKQLTTLNKDYNGKMPLTT